MLQVNPIVSYARVPPALDGDENRGSGHPTGMGRSLLTAIKEDRVVKRPEVSIPGSESQAVHKPCTVARASLLSPHSISSMNRVSAALRENVIVQQINVFEEISQKRQRTCYLVSKDGAQSGTNPDVEKCPESDKVDTVNHCL